MKSILPFSGFTENKYRASGIEDLWSKFLIKVASRDCIVYSPEIWKQPVRPLLAEMRRAGVTDLMLIGYSWGAGVGCIRTALEARNYGIRIRIAALCDPVYRSPFLPTWLPLNLLTLLSSQKIRIPASVQKVAWVRQKTNWPKAADLIAECPIATTIQTPLILPTTHGRIDEHELWKTLVENEVQKFILS